MAITENATVDKVVALIVAALESGSVKLTGTAGPESPASNAKKDAEYLNDLMTALAKNIKTLGQ